MSRKTRWSNRLMTYLTRSCEKEQGQRRCGTNRPGGVVILGSQVEYWPLQYAWAWGTWNGSSWAARIRSWWSEKLAHHVRLCHDSIELPEHGYTCRTEHNVKHLRSQLSDTGEGCRTMLTQTSVPHERAHPVQNSVDEQSKG